MRPKPSKPVHITEPKHASNRYFERAIDTLQVIDTLRLQLRNAGEQLSPASQTKIQTVEHTVLYFIDSIGEVPHPLRDIPEITDPLSQMMVGRTD